MPDHRCTTPDDLECAYTSTELHELCTRGRSLFLGAAAHLTARADELRHALAEVPTIDGTPPDMAAHRIAAYFRQAAEKNTIAAYSMRTTWTEFHELFQPQNGATNTTTASETADTNDQASTVPGQRTPTDRSAPGATISSNSTDTTCTVCTDPGYSSSPTDTLYGCNGCAGQGYVMHYCTTCNGQGYTHISPEGRFYDCDNCGLTGYVAVYCNVCRGTGWGPNRREHAGPVKTVHQPRGFTTLF